MPQPRGHRIPRIRRARAARRTPPRRRAVLAATGSLALLLATTPGLPAPSPAAAPATACALPAPAAPRTAGAPAAPAAIGGLTEAIAIPPDTPGTDYAPTTGTVTALTLFIDFPDARATLSTRQRFAEFFPATTAYFADASHGRLTYRPVPVHRWLRMPQPFERYGIDRGSGWHPDDPQGYNRLMRDVLAALGDDADPAAHDLVNVLAVPEAGPPATEQVLSVTFPGRPLLTTPTGPLRNVSFIWSRQPGESPHRVLVHENAHSFGLPDLYGAHGAKRQPLTGHWDVMEEDWGPSNDLLAWHKWKLRWLADHQVRCVTRAPGTTEHWLTPAGTPGPGAKLIAVRTGRHTALALEVRAPGGLDRVVCRPGVLVSRVDAAVPSGSGPVRVADATPRGDGCQPVPHPQVTASLTDAPYLPGQTFRDERARVSVTVLDADPSGRHRVRITRW
ncbi:M6 family metalloprotease domain-containing protein [Streptomyces sp. 6N223]|uniref:M6 family metalloprotease domain-containing protein n=1 Tax=Streptomyces sp. 6N223 TaxID=3457412 RepID=UPI003FD6094A